MFNQNFSTKFIDKIILNLKCKRFTPEETIFEVLNINYRFFYIILKNLKNK